MRNHSIEEKVDKGYGYALKPLQLVSLWDMIKIGLGDMAAKLIQLSEYCSLLQIESLRDPVAKLDDVNPGYVDSLRKFLYGIGALSVPLGLEGSVKFSDEIINDLQRISISSLFDDLRKLKHIIEKELGNKWVLYIQEDKAPWFDTNPSFSPDVVTAFRSALSDIKEAGKCYALDRPTACVFHLMRVAEIGLRALAYDRRVKCRKKGPLEFKEWNEILEGLEHAEEAIEGYEKTRAREAQYAFYHGAMVELRAFKNLYRNRTMHSREPSDSDQAHSALVHVSCFMKILASKISEKKRTPMIWKKV